MSDWTFSRSLHTLDMIEGLPLEGQFAVFELIAQLEDDPYLVTEPHGEDDGLTREAVFGGAGMIVVFVNKDTKRITPLQITWA